MYWNITTPATGTVLTWAQVQAQIQPGTTADETLIMDHLAEATSEAETKLGMCLLPQTITATFVASDFEAFQNYSVFPGQGRKISLPRGPLISVTSFTDANGTAVPYTNETHGNAIQLLPTSGINLQLAPFTVIYQAGFTTIPVDIQGAIRVLTATKFMYREGVSTMPANDIAKLDNFFKFRGAAPLVA
jgi:hypothetical protein